MFPIETVLSKSKAQSIHSSFEKTSDSKTFDLEFKDGSSYSGQVIKHGYGTFKDSRGNSYEGNWNLDKKQGHGKQTFVVDAFHKHKSVNDSNSSIEADFYKRGGKLETLVSPINISSHLFIGVYDGNFDQNQFSGFGKFTYNEGSYYEGTWKQDKMDGIGILYGSDGSVYNGEWKQNMKHGKGVYKDPQNNVLDGIWENDKYQMQKE